MMKKLTTLFLALMMCFSLVACGGPDRQPAIDAFNAAADAVNAAGELMNENADLFTQEDFDTMNGYVDTLNECGAVLEDDSSDLTEEQLSDLVTDLENITDWANDLSDAIKQDAQ